MKLMTNEKIIMSSDTNQLTLTTHRIRFKYSSFGFGNVISFLLSELDSCSVTYKSNPIFLVIGVLTFIGGLIAAGQRDAGAATGVLLVFTAIFIILYFVTRKSVLKISSKSSHIFVSIRGMSQEKIIDFIDTIESTKNNLNKY